MMANPLKEGYKRGKKGVRKGLEKLGERNMRVGRKDIVGDYEILFGF